MTDLPEVPRRLATTEAPRSSVSGREIASAYGKLSEAIGNVGEMIEEAGLPAQAEMGAKSVQRDLDGNVRVEPRIELSRADVAYNQAARAGALSEISGNVREKLAAMRIRHAGDPKRFAEAADDYRRELRGNYSGPMFAAVDDMVQREAQQQADGLSTDKINRDMAVSLDRIEAERQQKALDLKNLAYQGGLDTPEAQQALADYHTLSVQQSANPLLKKSRETVEWEYRRFSSDLIGETVNGKIARDYAADPAGAEKYAKEAFSNPSLALTPEERLDGARKAVSRLDDLSTSQRLLIQENKDRVVEPLIKTLTETNAKVDPTTISTAMREAVELHDPLSARRISEALHLREAVGVSGPALIERYDAATRGSGFEAALAGRESTGQADKVNTLGYAGLYQFGAPRLVDLGLYKPGPGENLDNWSKTGRDAAGKWTGTFAIPGHPAVKTLEQFLASPDAQKAAFEQHRGLMDQEITERGLSRFIGQPVAGVTLTRDGLYAMMHLGGAAGAKRALTGKGVARDAYGTSVLDYARLGQAQGPAESPLVQKALFDRIKSTLPEALTDAENLVEKNRGIDFAGAEYLVRSAEIVNDPELTSRTLGALFVNAQVQSAMPVPGITPEQTAALIGRLRVPTALGTDALRLHIDDQLQRGDEHRRKLLAEDAYQLGVESGFSKPLPPVDWSVPDGGSALLKERTIGVRKVAALNGAPPLSALSKVEAEDFRVRFEAAPLDQQGKMLAALTSSMDEDMVRATFGKIVDGNKPNALAWAGPLYKRNPDASFGVLRGAAVLKQDEKFGWTNDATTRSALDDVLPWFPARGARARTDLEEAVKAAYADRSFAATDRSQKLNNNRLREAVNAVTGGVIEFNGKRILPPVPAMTTSAFGGLMWSLRGSDAFDGAYFSDGTPVTGRDVNRLGKLWPTGDGRYRINFGTDTDPKFAVHGAWWDDADNAFFPGEPFELDLRQAAAAFIERSSRISAPPGNNLRALQQRTIRDLHERGQQAVTPPPGVPPGSLH